MMVVLSKPCKRSAPIYRMLRWVRDMALPAHVLSKAQADAARESPSILSTRDFAELIDGLIDWQSRLPDAADELLDTVCRMESAPVQATSRNEGDLFYMPTQVRQIEAAVRAGLVRSNDIFVDVGCGPGARLPVYVHLRTGALTVGVEKYSRYYEHAKHTVEELALASSIELAHCDALNFDYCRGTVFYFLRPVEGMKMKKLVDRFAAERGGRNTLILAGGGAEREFFAHPVFEQIPNDELHGLYAFENV